jgi:hypothetical protein
VPRHARRIARFSADWDGGKLLESVCRASNVAPVKSPNARGLPGLLGVLLPLAAFFRRRRLDR